MSQDVEARLKAEILSNDAISTPSHQALFQYPPSPETLDLIEHFMTGELVDGHPMTHSEILFMQRYSRELLSRLVVQKRMNDNLFTHIMNRFRDVLQYSFYHADVHQRDPAFFPFTDQYLWSCAERLNPDDCDFLRAKQEHFVGSRYVLLAARHVHNMGLTKLTVPQPYDIYNGQPSALIAAMANAPIADLVSDEQQEAFVREIQALNASRKSRKSKSPLMALIPVAKHARPLLAKALGCEDIVPLIDYLESHNVMLAALDVAALKAIVTRLGMNRTHEVLQLCSSSYRETVFCVYATLGENRDEVLRKFHKHAHVGIRAYGLLPLVDGETVLDRYLALEQSRKEGKQFGQMRRANHATSVEIALSHLAQVEGYANATQLEWDMETRLTQDSAANTWTIGDYVLCVAIDGVKIDLHVTRNGKTLKTVPKDIRASDEYKQARQIVTHLRAQVTRLRTELIEALMMTGDALPPDRISRLLTLPAARDMFKRLVWQMADGQCGLLDVETMTLQGLNGIQIPVDAPLSLSHPYDLFIAGTLADWQREIVRQHVVQPVKQVFRELYIVTPAEKETETFSNRFAGHVVDARITARLLVNRGWHVPSGEGITPYKIVSGLRASFEFPDAYHHMGAVVSEVTTDKLYFEPYPSYPALDGSLRYGVDNAVKLDTVPPRIFSEIMRDADLVVSVAQRGGDDRAFSNETYAQRAAIVRALMEDLGIPRVTIEGHFAYVQGKLARYRVHLGSAVIHIEPGNYLCIVPDRMAQKRPNLYLPFADEGDAKLTEAISKILLLVADDQIKDESIIRQIRHYSR